MNDNNPYVWIEVVKDYVDSAHAEVKMGGALFARASAAGYTEKLKVPSNEINETWLIRCHKDGLSPSELYELVRGYRQAINAPSVLFQATLTEIPRSPKTGARDLEKYLIDHAKKSFQWPAVWFDIVQFYLLDLARQQRWASLDYPKFVEMNGQQVAWLIYDNWHLGDRGFVAMLDEHREQGTLDDLVPTDSDLGISRASQPSFSTRLNELERRLGM